MEKFEIPPPFPTLGNMVAIDSELFEELRGLVYKLHEVMKDAYEFRRN